MSAGAQSSWKPPDADRQPSAWSPPESDRTPSPAELSPLAKTGKAYSEGLGIPQLLDVLRMSNRYGTPQEVAARGERGMTALKGIVQGIAGEPARVWDELSRTGESMLKGDLSGTAYHLAGAVPVLGAQSQQAAMDLQRGDPAAFVGHVGAMVTPFAAGPAVRAIEALPEAAQRAGVAATGAAKGGWQGATGPTVLPIKVKGVQLAEISNVPASISGAITGGGVGGLLGGGKGSVIGALSGATVPIVRGAVKGARSALADLDAIAARAAQEEALANRVPLWEQQGTAATPRPVPQFTSQQPPMGMDVEGNLRPGPLPSGRRVPGEAAEVRGPAITPDDVLLLRYLGETDPLSASAENIGIARDLAKQNPELVNRLRAGEPEPIVPPPTAAEAAAPTTQAVGTLEYNAPDLTPPQERIVKGAQQAGEFTPEEMARAAAILENVEPQTPPAPAAAAPTPAAIPAAETPLQWTRAEIIDRGGALPAVSEIQRRFKMGYGAATDVLREAQGLRPKGEPIVTPRSAPAAPQPAAPQPQTVGGFMREAPPTPGQIYAQSQGYDWAKLSADDRAALEHVAQAQANMAEQQLPVTPPAAQPQSAADFMRGTEPASELETQLADSLAAVKARKQSAPETPPEAPAPKPENIYAKNARLAKAVRVADAAQEAGLTSFDVFKMSSEDFARKVGEKSISADTMAMVVDKLRKLEADAARAARAAPK